MKVTILIIILLFTVQIARGQENFPNTKVYYEYSESPEANLNSLDWIKGYWRGEAFDGITEAVWTPELGGSMMCAFKLVTDKQVKFYELLTISEENNTLILRLKHFHSDLKGWELKDETVDFKLVEISPNKMYFDGFTFEKNGEDEMNIYVIIQNGKEKREVKFPYKKSEL